MTNEWNLRNELFEISHRWQQVFLAFLLGSLLGWVLALIFPTPHRAQSELYVAYNGDAIFRNADDYKNWQFGELEAYVVSNDVLGETLKRLSQQDPYWQDISVEELKPSLRTYWRNAGKWRLVAEWRGEQRAQLLGETWTQVVLDKSNVAADHARSVFSLEARLDANARSQIEHRLKAIQLQQIYNALNAWRGRAAEAQPGAPLDVLERWRLQSLAANAASLLPGELSLVAQPPAEGAETVQYIPAVDQALIALAEEIAIADQQTAELAAQHEALMQQWDVESKASHNLTAHLTVEPGAVEHIVARPVRLTSQVALVGGALGLLLWGLVFLGRPLRKGRAER